MNQGKKPQEQRVACFGLDTSLAPSYSGSIDSTDSGMYHDATSPEPVDNFILDFINSSEDDIETIRGLFQDYAYSLNVDLGYQGFNEELSGLPGSYAPPRGRLLLVTTAEGHSAGCVAMRPRSDTDAEMKRLYVSPGFQRRGLGRYLVQSIINEARGLNYKRLLLDTLPSMHSAISLYESLGFVRCDPYFETPIAGNVFMELTL